MKSENQRPLRIVPAVALGFLLGGFLATACSNNAGASTFVNGPVTLTPTTPLASGQNLSSGQTIDISVSANSTLDQSSLAAAGIPSGVAVMRALECDDPNGLTSKLPTSEAYHCDGNTLMATSYVNADGSFKIDDFVVYSLPDKPTFDEGSGSLPVCGTEANQCVLYIGPNPQDFTKPHLFSAPFLVTPTANDQGLGVSGNGGSNGLASAASEAGSNGGTLAYTGGPGTTLMMLGTGMLLAVGGTAARRRLRHRLESP